MTTTRLARDQGYREGYARALADVQLEIARAIDVAYEGAGIRDYVRALQHARVIARGLAARVKAMEGDDY